MSVFNKDSSFTLFDQDSISLSDFIPDVRKFKFGNNDSVLLTEKTFRKLLSCNEIVSEQNEKEEGEEEDEEREKLTFFFFVSGKFIDR